MSKVVSNQDPSGFSPQEIIALGEELASLSRFTDQKEKLAEVFQNTYECETFIWLNAPLKSLQIKNPSIEFPIDPQSKKLRVQLSQKGLYRYEGPDNNWLILPLNRGNKDIGLIFLQKDSPFHPSMHQQLKDIAKVAGLALFATLQTELQNWRQKQLALVRAVSRQISQITDLQILTAQITDRKSTRLNSSHYS